MGKRKSATRAVAIAWGGLVAAAVAGAPAAAVELPVPCAPGACGSSGPTSLGQATATVGGSTMTVTTGSSKSLLNWSSFNIGAGGTVNFVQPSATSIALNRIFQASPSQIFGALNANGQIYLINQNGFIFGPKSSVSASSLVASSLNISDAVFGAGIASPTLSANGTLTPSLTSDGRTTVQTLDGLTVLDASGQPIPVKVAVQAGAQLSAAPGGRIILAGQTVENAGTLSAPQGQVILAAGRSVYLQASTDPTLRGLYVEVDDAGGKVWNQSSGVVTTPDGNITLVGLAVNQDGRLSATTSVAANGSVRLLARAAPIVDTGAAAGSSPFLPQQGGTLTLGSTSAISVTPDTDATTAVDAVAQPKSAIELSGRQIDIGGSLLAPGGLLTAVAAANPSQPGATADPQTQLRVESGASIDLSGATVTVPVTRNLVAVDLRANELADDPLQRNGPLRGQTVVVDARVGTPIANVSGAIAGIGRTVAERLGSGGTARFSSDGDIVVASGATLNVSGGVVNYTGGYMQTTKLVAPDGSLVDIGSASPNVAYTGLVNPTISQSYNVWGVKQVTPSPTSGTYEAGYTDGQAAGSLSFAARTIVLDGALLGQSVSGPRQRLPSQVVPGGTLTIGVPGGLPGVAGVDYDAPSVAFVGNPTATVVADGTPLPASLTLELPVAALTSGGFTRTSIYSNGSITLPSGLPLALAAGSSLTLRGERISVGSDVVAPGGVLDFGALTTVGVADAVGRLGIVVDPGVSLDVRGVWVNDLLAAAAAPTAPIYTAGGRIALSLQGATPDVAAFGGELVLGDGASLLASGGAWLSQSGVLNGGAGGSISLLAGVQDAALRVGDRVALSAYGVNGAGGGSFALETQRIEVLPGQATWAAAQSFDPLAAGAPPFFAIGDGIASGYGFANVTLTASGRAVAGDTLRVDAGAHLASVVDTLMLGSNALGVADARNVAPFATVTRLDPGLRQAGSLTLATGLARGYFPSDIGRLVIDAGAVVSTDPGGSVALKSLGSIEIAGSIVAPGGSVAATMRAPDVGSDPGYDPTLAIELAPGALIDVSGVRVLKPNAQGLLLGTVLGGGSVRLVAARGSVLLEPGSAIRADGTAALLDVQPANAPSLGIEHLTVSSNGGSIDLESPEALLLAGSLGLHAGAPGAQGGALSVALDATLVGFIDPNLQQVPTTPRVLTLDGQSPALSGPQPSGTAVVPVALVSASGAGSLSLLADGDFRAGWIELRNSPTLTLPEALRLTAPSLQVPDGGTAALTAAYVAVTGRQGSTPVVASGGEGALTVHAAELDLIGPSTLVGIGTTTLASTGDVRLTGSLITTPGGNAYGGSLDFAGDLTISAGQVYPTTATAFTIRGDATSRVEFDQLGTAPQSPLSAAGSLSVIAGQIVQAGTVRAPFGTIEFDAAGTLTLAPGSYTSVSGAGLLVPYGVVTLGGAQWNYSNGTGQGTVVTTTPARAVTLNAPAVTIAPGATVDLRGGGDLAAAEFVPGTGGTKPVLDPGATPGLYAILPSMRGQYGPYDPQTYAGTGLTPGASVYLTGAPGLPAGSYPLLPASYALLPGAILVRAMPTLNGLAPGINLALPDGSTVVPGYLSFGATGLGATQYMGFDIQPGSYATQLATYQTYRASTFLPPLASLQGLPAPDLPANAGRLALEVQQNLTLGGTVLTAAATGGLGASLDIAAPALVVTHGNAGAPPDAVAVSDAALNDWAPATVLLGGTRSSADGSISVVAGSVEVAAGASLVAQDIVLVAADTIHVAAGATLASSSGAGGAAAPAALVPTTVTLAGPGGASAALLSVSDLAERVAVRSGGGVSPLTQVVLDPGSRLASGGAVVVDAAGGASLGGDIAGSGAAWSLTANRLVLGAGAPVADPAALTVTSALAAGLGTAGSVRLAAGTSIDVVGAIALGTGTGTGQPTIGALTLAAPAITNLSGLDAAFGARSIALVGTGTAATPGAAGAGQLTLTATDISIGPGSLSVSGFGSSALVASHQIEATGTTTLDVAGSLELSAPRVTGTSGATAGIAASGALLIDGTPAQGAATPSLGAALSFSGSSIDVRGSVVASAGLIALQSAGDLRLGAGATLDTSGVLVTVGDRSVGAAGGTVSLSAGGALTTDAASRISVAGAGGERGGAVLVAAGGTTDLAGALQAGHGGDFALTAQSVADFTGLDTHLATGGFSGDRALHVVQGDLVVAANDAISARSISLATDGGAIVVDGTLAATGGSSGSGIRLYAGGDVAINGALHADAGAGAVGGTIVVGSTQGRVSFAGASQASAVGGAGDGVLTVRATALGTPAAGASDGFTLDSLPADLSGFSQVRLVPVLAPFSLGANPTAAQWGAVQQQVSGFYGANGAAIASRLNPTGAASVVVMPGVDVVAPGALTLGALDLSRWRFGGEPVALTVRAGGTLTVSGAISDGFQSVAGSTQLLGGDSASLVLVGGASLSSADPLATVAGAAADVVFTSGPGGIGVVRTGAGTIDLAAARDVLFASTGNSVYSAGRPAAAGVAQGNNRPRIEFPVDSGAVTVTAGRDIIGALPKSSLSQWFARVGDATDTLGWGVALLPPPGANPGKFTGFNWNVGSLGGGSVALTAGRNVVTMTAAAAESALPGPTGASTLPGGSIVVRAGGDVDSSAFYVGQGSADLRAGGAFGVAASTVNAANPDGLGTSFAVGDARITMTARTGIQLEPVIEAPLVQQVAGPTKVLFVDYGATSGISLESAAGDVVMYAGDVNTVRSRAVFGGLLPQVLNVLPASLGIHALSGSARLDTGEAWLFPAPRSTFDVLAARDVVLAGTLSQSDADPAAFPSQANPLASNNVALATSALGDAAAVHLGGDTSPALISAGRDITAASTASLGFATSARLIAGRDILNVSLTAQNLSPSDMTLVSAGRDFRPDAVGGDSNAVVQVGGPGSLDVIAGRDIDLGFAQGIVTNGRQGDSALPFASGANLTVVAGLGQPIDPRRLLYFDATSSPGGLYDPSKDVGPPDPARPLRGCVGAATYCQQLVDYTAAATGSGALSLGQAVQAFATLSPDVQRGLELKIFFGELLQSGREANDPTLRPNPGFSRGYLAIDTLFPGSRDATTSAYRGDLSMAFSRIYTLAGGDLSIVVPGGVLNVGLAVPPANVVARGPSQLGIVAEGAGDVNIYTRDDVLVNSSRIFTLGGGNVLVWSTLGNIDAGRGAKTALSAPPPVVLVDADGNVTLDYSATVAGSGIRTIRPTPQVGAGSVDLIAPAGFVNAGDAGIGAAGNLNIAAQQVIGLGNIQVGGTSTGVPAETSSLGASLSAASGAGSSASSAAAAAIGGGGESKDAAAPLASGALGWLEVFVTGLGEESCRPDDLDCLKRQKRN